MGLSLAEARLLLIKAKRSLEEGVSPSCAKAEKKAAKTDALTFGKWVERYFEFKGDPKSKGEQLADSTLAMRRSTCKRALEKPLGKLMLEEVTPNRLAAPCDDIKAQRGPAVAVHAREIVLMVFRHVQRKGVEVSNPAERVQASTIARFEPRDRAPAPTRRQRRPSARPRRGHARSAPPAWPAGSARTPRPASGPGPGRQRHGSGRARSSRRLSRSSAWWPAPSARRRTL